MTAPVYYSHITHVGGKGNNKDDARDSGRNAQFHLIKV